MWPTSVTLIIDTGIGRQTAISFAQHGIQKLALADVNIEGLEEANSALAKEYPEVEILTLHMDVQDLKQVQAGIGEIVKKFGRLDVAVNNAGIPSSGRKTHETDEEEWIKVLNIDLNGVWRCQREEVKVMLEQE